MKYTKPKDAIATRATGLLAAAEANDGGTPETDAFIVKMERIGVRISPEAIDHAKQLEQRCNALAARVRAMKPEQLRVADRITAYLSGGGLFNPELANHDAVRDLLIDARDELHMLRLHIADKNATITAMGATHEKLAARVRELERGIEIATDRLTGPGGVLSAIDAARSK